jgi:hypothetical protein
MMDCKSMTTLMVIDLNKMRDSDSDPVDLSLYGQLIGSLMYFVNTQSGILFGVNTLSQFQMERRHEHWIAAKNILRYLPGMLNYVFRYASNGYLQLHGFTDSNWIESADDRKSTYGICFSFGYAMISWDSMK